MRTTLILVLLYAVGYAVCRLLLGPGFVDTGLLDYTHFLDPSWLVQDFWGSLWYLHSQPPMMNALIGGIFLLWGEDYRLAFQVLYFFCGALTIGFLYGALTLAGVRRNISLVLCSMLCLNPTFYMFGTWYYSPHLELLLCSVAVYCLSHFFCKPTSRLTSLIGFFGACALLGLTRGQWHLGIFLGITLFLFSIERGRVRVCILVLSTICLVPLAGWYAKNQYVFGFFGPSSWMGANIAQPVLQLAAVDRRVGEFIDHERGVRIAADYPGDFISQRILKRVPEGSLPAESQHMALAAFKSTRYGTRNFNLNYAGMILSARTDARDTVFLLRNMPQEYIMFVLRKLFAVMYTPSLFHTLLNPNPHLVYRSTCGDVCMQIAFAGSLLLYLVCPVLLLACGRTRLEAGQYKLAQTIFALAFALLLVACAANGGEQDRMRWGWLPCYLVMAGLMVEVLLKEIRHIRIIKCA